MKTGVDRLTELTILDTLPLPAVAAMLKALYLVPDSSPATRLLYQRIAAQLQPGYIYHGDLYEVFALLDAVATLDLGATQSQWLAYALQRLTKSEQKPGGPYNGRPETQVAANRAIRDFLQHFDVALPQLELYLEANVTAAAELVWPPFEQRFIDLAQQCKWLSADMDNTASVEASGAMQAAILELARQRMQALPAPLDQLGLQQWDEMRRADRNHEIVLLPQMVAGQFTDQTGITDIKLQLLGAANFFCWIATVLYDDFIDEEGAPERLPIANVAYRASLDLYREVLVERPELYEYVERMYDAVDRANAWEVLHTRAVATPEYIDLPALPDYGDQMVLADRAYGHIIGAMLLVQQIPAALPDQIRLAETAFKHYLIARQLNDDIHDWRKDLQAGQLSTALVTLLLGAGVGPGKHRFADLIPRLETYVFSQGLDVLYARLQSHVRQSREAHASSGLMAATGGFSGLVDDLEASAQAALQVRDSQAAFLQTYQQIAG